MKTDTDKIIINNIKSLRIRKDYTQGMLAEVIGTSSGFIGQIESELCDSKYSAYQIYLIAEEFRCPVSDIYPPVKSIENL
ncbi:MAG: helix-turn-helix domain-containing protein [Alistipes sp.]|nr:helix-turn-helix domain-containing protein [Alistipes sp.]